MRGRSISKREPSLVGVVRSREPLIYDAGEASAERPLHVRGASGLCFIGGELVVIQDDASLLAVRSRAGRLRAIGVPWAPGGRQVFEERLGNKLDKLDFEACFPLSDTTLVILGSGSKPVREKVAVVSLGGEPVVDLFASAPLYARIGSALELEAGELNIEGAVVVDDTLRVFQRGNSRKRPNAGPATIDLDLEEFRRFVAARGNTDAPSVRDAERWDLGSAGGVPYGFTDATRLSDGRVIFLAAAEDSLDAIADGAVAGTLIGILDEARAGPIVDPDGQTIAIKAEGIAVDPHDGTLFVVIDADDPDEPAELCRIDLDY